MFTDEYLNFFTELAFNNEKSWFDKNRKRYEDYVRDPFKEFTSEMIAEIQKFDPKIGNLEPKDVMFRINRDIRFSKDKTPYNTWLSAAIVPGGKKHSDNTPGYYYRFAVDGLWVGGGMFHPDKEHLTKVRRKIAEDPAKLHKLVESPSFKKYWDSITGEENKVMPAEFKDAAQKEPLLRKKQFMFFHEYPETEITRPDLKDWLLDQFKAGQPLKDYLDV